MNTAAATLDLPMTNAPASAPSLKDMLQEGIYLLFLLRNGNVPASATELGRRIEPFERGEQFPHPPGADRRHEQRGSHARARAIDQHAIHHLPHRAFCQSHLGG